MKSSRHEAICPTPLCMSHGESRKGKVGLPGRQQASVTFSSCCTAPTNTRWGFLALLNISCMVLSKDETAWHADVLLARDYTSVTCKHVEKALCYRDWSASASCVEGTCLHSVLAFIVSVAGN